MKVRQIMHCPAIATTVEVSARQIATEICFHRFSGLPVNDRQGRVIGVISEADLLRAIRDGKELSELTVADIMSTEPISVDEDDDVKKVLDILVERHLVRVPVTQKGKLIGIVSRSDVIRASLHDGFGGY